MIVTQVSDTELKIDATPISHGSNQVTFTAVDTFDTATNVKVTFTGEFCFIQKQRRVCSLIYDSLVPAPQTPSASTPGGGSRSPDSKSVSSASQLQALGLVCLIGAVFA
jgi:hypothetical protein